MGSSTRCPRHLNSNPSNNDTVDCRGVETTTSVITRGPYDRGRRDRVTAGVTKASRLGRLIVFARRQPGVTAREVLQPPPHPHADVLYSAGGEGLSVVAGRLSGGRRETGPKIIGIGALVDPHS